MTRETCSEELNEAEKQAAEDTETVMSNRIWPRTQDSRPKPVIRKVPTDSVPYGTSMTHRATVWAAYLGDELVATAATSAEVRVKYNHIIDERMRSRSS